ncbi:MAG: class I SAM-dependent RNA methyltransferase [Thermoanaerobaculia bacterium]
MNDGDRGRNVARRLAELDELTVTVERLVTGGEGLARFEGIPIFIPRAAPGDRLRVRLVERRPGYGRAEIEEILQPGPGRRDPPCPHFARCGGCDLQHLDDALQVRLKVEAVRETLQRLGGLTWPEKVRVVAGESWAYRMRTSLHTRPVAGGHEVGYFARRSHDLVVVERCPVLVPELERIVERLGRLIPAEGPRRIDLAAGRAGEWTAAPVVEGLDHGPLEIDVEGNTYTYDARCFFQAHRSLLGELVNAAVGIWEGERAVDLYAGVGLFSIPLARRYAGVHAIEGDRVAVRYARTNARRNAVPNLQAEHRTVERWIDLLPAALDRVLVDPPRTGLTRPVRRALLERPPARLTYVSCDAAILARDLKELARSFAVESLTLLDLFPQTGHMETVVQLAAR